MKFTKHAQERLQQRGFQKGFVDLVLNYGIPCDKKGDVIEYRIPKKQKQVLISELKRMIDKIEKSSNKAVLLDNSSDSIITVYNIIN